MTAMVQASPAIAAPISTTSDRPSIFARLWRQVAYRRTIDALDQLSDRDLADIGISRAEIPVVARGVCGL